MNNKGTITVKQEKMYNVPQENCEICLKKDEEDLYIIFNVIYRVVIGGVFHKKSKDEELSYELDMMQRLESEIEEGGLRDEEQTPEQKILSFKEKISRQLLMAVITSSEFNTAIKDIFKAKYETLNEECRHSEIAIHFLNSFEISNDSSHNCLAQEVPAIIAKIKALHNSLHLIKSEIQAYQSEIQKLSDHIVSKLFTSNSNLVKNFKEEEKIDRELELDGSESDESELTSDEEIQTGKNPIKGRKRLGKKKKSSSSGNNGTTEGNKNSDKSTDATSSMQFQNESRKQPKSPVFKSKLPKKATDVLKTWFLNHVQNPYPSHEAKETLSTLTGLSKKQIQNWFTNSRKRFLEPLKKKIDPKKKPDGNLHSVHNENDSVAEDKLSQTRNQITPDKISFPGTKSDKHHIQPSPNHSTGTQEILPNSQPQLQFNSQIPLQDPSKYVPQRVIPAPTMMPATIMYQGYLPQQNNFNQQGNIVILQPYVVPQGSIIYPYGNQQARGLIPVHPQYVQLPQGNTITVVNQSNLLGGSYIVPLQPNIGVLTKHNLSTNFNTINNNVYNSINNMGSSSDMTANEGTNETSTNNNNNNNNTNTNNNTNQAHSNGERSSHIQGQNSQFINQSQPNLLLSNSQPVNLFQQPQFQPQLQSQLQSQLQPQFQLQLPSQLQPQQQIYHQPYQYIQQLPQLQQLQQPMLQPSNRSIGGESGENGNFQSSQKAIKPKQELSEVYNTSKHLHKEDEKET